MTFRVRIANGLIRALNSWLIDLALMKTTKITERVDMEFGVQFFNIFNHVQLGDPGTDNLALNYTNVPDSAGNPTNQYIVSPVGNLGQITSTNNFNNQNDNAASPNTGTGLPRQIQFMLRVKSEGSQAQEREYSGEFRFLSGGRHRVRSGGTRSERAFHRRESRNHEKRIIQITNVAPGREHCAILFCSARHCHPTFG